MNKTIKDLAKIFHTIHAVFFAIILSVIFYLSILFINDYIKSKEIDDLFKLIIPISLLVYMMIMIYLTNLIEMRLYKENLENIIELLMVHSLMYGIITPFAMLNYYILYMIIVVYKPEGLNTIALKDDKYYYSKIALRYAIFVFIPYVLYKYINILIKMYHNIIDGNDIIKINTMIYLGILLFAFFQMKIAERDFKENKYGTGAIRCLVIAIFTNPFTFHGAFLIFSGAYTLYKDDNFTKIKDEAIKLKDRIMNK